MGDGPFGAQIYPDHFLVSTSAAESSLSNTDYQNLRSQENKFARVRSKTAASVMNLFNLKRLSWGLVSNGEEKVILNVAEVESLRSEISSLEERESHYKAQLEHIDEILRSAHLSGYLFIRARWTALPGEPEPIDDIEVDDWLQRFIVLQGSCLYLYKNATDLSPQDSTLLSEVVEVGYLPSLEREDGETRVCFYILTRHGLRYECSSTSQMQVDSWLAALRTNCKLKENSELDLHDVPTKQ